MSDGLLPRTDPATPPARFAYCILSHRNPAQVERLVRRIQELSPDSLVVVHHDPRGEPLHGEAARAKIWAAHADWGRWSLAESMLRCFAASFERGADAAVIISGQDYPVRHLPTWEREVLALDVSAVLAASPVAPPAGRGATQPADDRYLRAWLRWFALPRTPQWWPQLPESVSRLRWKVIHRLQPAVCYRIMADGRAMVGIRRRRTPFDSDHATCYWGPQWLALRRDGIERLLAAKHTDSPIYRLFRSSLIPDESYVQTVLMNSDLAVHQGHVTFASWTGATGEQHPQPMSNELLDLAAQSRLPFARKFNWQTDSDLLDRADLLSEEPA